MIHTRVIGRASASPLWPGAFFAAIPPPQPTAPHAHFCSTMPAIPIPSSRSTLLMFGFFKKSAPPQRESILAAIPLRNPVVRQTTSHGKTMLVAPIQATRLKRFFGTRAQEKSFELDALGLDVWTACDGRTTVEQIITHFARQHRINLREAEVSVSTFLRTLISRNLMALAGTTPQAPREKSPRQPRKKSRR